MNVSKNIIFLGLPGSGKGTISSQLQKRANILQISTGDIFREEIKKQSDLGMKVQKIVESGAYVPDDVTNEIIKNKLNDLQKEDKKFILDGYPRTVQQAMYLDELKFDNYVVIFLDIDKEIVIKRLSERFFCSVCKRTFNLSEFKSAKHPDCEFDDNELIQRADDQPEAVKKRLDVYEEQTMPLIDFYKDKGKLISINSNNDVDIIVNEILDIIK